MADIPITTNTITIYVTNITETTNTITIYVTNITEITNTITNIPQLDRVWYKDFSFWGMIATVASAIIMAITACIIKQQSKTAQLSSEAQLIMILKAEYNDINTKLTEIKEKIKPKEEEEEEEEKKEEKQCTGQAWMEGEAYSSQVALMLDLLDRISFFIQKGHLNGELAENSFRTYLIKQTSTHHTIIQGKNRTCLERQFKQWKDNHLQTYPEDKECIELTIKKF
ncbi:MAG: hypothetical protein ACRCY4_05920 [Brevinema sp.]